MYGLKGKTAVVTGSGRRKGIGEAIIMRLAIEGCNVVISDIGQAKGKQFGEEHIGTTDEMESIAAEGEFLNVGAVSPHWTIPSDTTSFGVLPRQAYSGGRQVRFGWNQ